MRISDWSSDVCSSDLPVGVVNTGYAARQYRQFFCARLKRQCHQQQRNACSFYCGSHVLPRKFVTLLRYYLCRVEYSLARSLHASIFVKIRWRKRKAIVPPGRLHRAPDRLLVRHSERAFVMTKETAMAVHHHHGQDRKGVV